MMECILKEGYKLKKEYKNMLYVLDYRLLGVRFAIHYTDNTDCIILGKIAFNGKLLIDLVKGTPQFKKHIKKYIKNLCRLFNLECDFRCLKYGDLNAN